MEQSLDLLREHCAVDASPELVLAIRSLPATQLDDLVDQLLDRRWHPDESRPSAEVWPLVNARASTFTTGGSNRWYTGTAGPAGLNLVAAIDPRSTGTGRFPAGVLRALLYSHGLVIEDPVLLAAELYTGTSSETRSIARVAIEAAVSSVLEIAPLIDARVVDTFFTPTAEQGDAAVIEAFLLTALDEPSVAFDVESVWDAFEVAYVDGLPPPLRDLWRRIRQGDRSPSLELVEQASDIDAQMARVFINVVAELRPRDVVENAVSVVATALANVARHGAVADLLCPSRLFLDLAFVGDPDPRHAVRLHQLAEIEVPRIDHLMVEDAVKIRQESDIFARWRTDLAIALERASTFERRARTGCRHLRSRRRGAERDAAGSTPRSEPITDHVGGRRAAFPGRRWARRRTRRGSGRRAGAALGRGGRCCAVPARLRPSRTLPTFLDRHYLLFDGPPAT